ncbi:TPR repeat-containing protein YfgC precursor [Lacunisphaera limnophila]|uniref:TPR repeat-containing protein YfgC n=1 Tax=Lacunisphaera limnophila TaxID=1838286 RepID=A0A1D8AS28_9BACT|nr:M48 family metallopeptidase [Lacunisphaera limnophila]AOS43669.1 TPR repeat-containing protein YfgC precursor [Lacunisphaera limnophila]
MHAPRLSPALRLAGLALCGVLLVSSGCYQVPVTGRAAVNMVSDEAVVKMSQTAFADLKKRTPLSRNQADQARVRQIGERLAKVAFWDVPAADWEFVVFDSPQQINAFAMAGGKVGVYSGLFQICHNDDQLASVLAHEIAHVAAKHVNERLSQDMAIQGGGLLVGGVMSTTGAGAIPANAVLNAYGLSSSITATGFDRGKEKEADHIGLIYMARAGYNPEEAPKVIENLEQASAGRVTPPAFLSTHPSYPERILQLLDLMPQALEIYQRSGQTRAPQLVK